MQAQSRGSAAGRTSSRRGAPRLTARDVEIVRWITRHGVVTTDLVGRRFFWRADQRTYGQWAAYRRLRALKALGLILVDRPFARHARVIRVTRAGANLAKVGLRPAPLVLAGLQHALAVVALGEYLAHQHVGAELTTERELWAQRYRAFSAGTPTEQRGRVPDAVLRIPGPDGGIETIGIELDLSRKDRRAIEEVIHRYDHTDVDVVWWYLAPDRMARLKQIIAELDAADRFEVRPWRT